MTTTSNYYTKLIKRLRSPRKRPTVTMYWHGHGEAFSVPGLTGSRKAFSVPGLGAQERYSVPGLGHYIDDNDLYELSAMAIEELVQEVRILRSVLKDANKVIGGLPPLLKKYA